MCMIASMEPALNLRQQSEDKTDTQQANLDSPGQLSLLSIFCVFDPDSPSRAKYYRTNTAKYTIEHLLLFFK
jgi:hypothetical protein